jgi:DNA-binding CsgD family transcriptional regulator
MRRCHRGAVEGRGEAIEHGNPGELRGELDRFKAELRAAGLSGSTVHSYLTGARLFARWLAGDYAPGENRAQMPPARRLRATGSDEEPEGLPGAAGSLESSERQVLDLRRGRDGETPLSRGEIAQRLGITSARVAQLEKQALRKARRRRDAAIVTARRQGHTLREIGVRFGMSRERVRQILAEQ